MTTKFFKFLLDLLRVNSKKHKTAGFTLIELLVALIIGSLIISSLLGLVVDILQADRDESAFNETQREMQMALNYISRELREAVYVYDANCLTLREQGTRPTRTTPASEDFCPGLLNHLPIDIRNSRTLTPILAFWKPEEIRDGDMPNSRIDAAGAVTCIGIPVDRQQECRDILVKRRTYTLVVYLQSTDSEGTRWSGKTRIVRYALPHYSDTTRLTVSQGYVSPYNIEESRTFQTWPINISDGSDMQLGAGGRPQAPGNRNVLVDFVDAPDANLALDNIRPLECPDDNYIRTPATLPTSPNNSFYTCVRRVILATTPPRPGEPLRSELRNVNQDVIIYLRGNAVGKQGIKNERNFRPVLQTQVLVRGVIDKNPQQ